MVIHYSQPAFPGPKAKDIYKPFLRPKDSDITALDAFTLATSVWMNEASCQDPRPHWVVTSPNMDYIPQCGHLFSPRYIEARMDGRFGHEDFTQYPQLFVDAFCHSAAVPRRPEEPCHPLQSLWRDPVREDFVFSSRADQREEMLGKIGPPLLQAFRIMKDNMSVRIREFILDDTKDKSDHKYLTTLENALRHCLNRLDFVPCSYRDFVVQVREFQRICLDILGWLQYETDSLPRMRRRIEGGERGIPSTSPDSVDYTRVGAFTFNLDVAQNLFLAGLPVWLIRDSRSIPSDMNIVTPTTLVDMPVMLRPWSNDLGEANPFPTLHTDASSEAVHVITRRWGRFYADFPDPVARPALVAQPLPAVERVDRTEESSNVRSREANGAAARRQQARKDGRAKPYNPPSTSSKSVNIGGRDRFEEPISDHFPPPIPVWRDANSSVDRSPERLHAAAILNFGYPFPDPGLFSASSRRNGKYLAAWMRMREEWLSKVVTSLTGPVQVPSLSGQQWRDWLFVMGVKADPVSDLSGRYTTLSKKRVSIGQVQGGSAPSGGSRSERSIQKTKEIVCAQMGDTDFPSRVFNAELEAMEGNVSHLEPKATAAVIWELYEQNFRVELLSLDRVVMRDLWSNEEGAVHRDNLIQAVFPSDTGYFVRGTPSSNVGLAALKVQDRRPYILSLHAVMQSWPTVPKGTEGFKVRNEADTLYLEQILAKAYCQTFFNYFRRAPILPRRIPE